MSLMCEESDDSLVLSRLSTRESSTLTFASVASSASLVVLTLTIERGAYHCLLELFGMAFAILGIMYREATFFSDQKEYCMLTSRFRERLERAHQSKFQKGITLLRRFIVRLFLYLPIVAWVAFFNPTYLWCVSVFVLALAMFPSLPWFIPKCIEEKKMSAS